MKNKDSVLIQRTLDGDQSAFTTLVEKYQKGVHALVWQKIGDFHVAQEITQDAFLKAYQKLGTLKNHNLFSGWLYVIATRLCYEWCRKKRIPIQSLETVDSKEVDQVAYTFYVEEERESDADDARRELVQNLLKKLPESERTVMTLHYLGEMSCESISEFLGVSSNTIRSRLNRARNRLRKEESMIKENLSSFQLPTQMTENIMKKISQLTPTTTPISKPFVPWVLSTASAIFVVLLMGVGAMKLHQYQIPYSIDASSESMIEIVDVRNFVESQTEPTRRNHVGKSSIPTENNGIGVNSEDSLFAAAQQNQTEVANVKQKWVQTTGPEGGTVPSLFKTTRGDVFAGTRHGLYRLNDDGTTWKLINNIEGPNYLSEISRYLWWPVVERHENLYLANDTEILVSTDRGETWKFFCKSKEGTPIGMILADGLPDAKSDLTIYLAFHDSVFRTIDTGKTWIELSEGLTDRKIRSIAAIENSVFFGTDDGLFRYDNEKWEFKSVIPEADAKDNSILDMVATEKHIYVVTGEENIFENIYAELIVIEDSKSILLNHKGWTLYRSNDYGNTWDCIDPRDKDSHSRFEIGAKIAAQDDKILLADGRNHYISNDGGENWILPDLINSTTLYNPMSLLLDDSNTYYKSGYQGIDRTTDEGKTWHQFNTGLIATMVLDVVSMNDVLYVREAGKGIFASTDYGKSWEPVGLYEYNDSLMVDNIGVLYVSKGNHQIMCLSDEENDLTNIQDMPKLMMSNDSDWIEIDAQPIPQLAVNRDDTTFHRIGIKELDRISNFAVSNSTFYVEYRNQLLRWKPGTSEWHITSLKYEDNDRMIFNSNFEMAVSGKTLYVGKQGGQLLQSFDEGDTWNNVTAKLPFSVVNFHAITFLEQNVYVGTVKGAIRSNNGTDWKIVTDIEGKPLEVRKFAVDGNGLYGLAKNTIYKLKEDLSTWIKVTPEIPYSATCFDVDGSNVYIGTLGRGVYHLTLED